jgi:hypothetical protein
MPARQAPCGSNYQQLSAAKLAVRNRLVYDRVHGTMRWPGRLPAARFIEEIYAWPEP